MVSVICYRISHIAVRSCYINHNYALSISNTLKNTNGYVQKRKKKKYNFYFLPRTIYNARIIRIL